MNIVVAIIILFIFIVVLAPIFSGVLIPALLLLTAVVVGIIIWKRNFEMKKSVLKDYDSEKLMIQNVQRGGVIRLLNVDGQNGDLDLKVVGRNLYMEGDYSWFELECVNAEGEKFWVDVEDDDELVVSIVLKKLQKAVPKERWIKTHHQMIFFGRYHCKAMNPQCQDCPLIDMCKEPKRKKYLEKTKD